MATANASNAMMGMTNTHSINMAAATRKNSMTDVEQPANSTANNTGGAMTIGSKPTLITTTHLRFLIMDAPRQSNLHLYIKECRRNHVTDIVRVCEPTYLGSELKSAGINLHEMAYEDGHSPPDSVLDRWLTLVEERFFGAKEVGVGSEAKEGG